MSRFAARGAWGLPLMLVASMAEVASAQTPPAGSAAPAAGTPAAPATGAAAGVSGQAAGGGAAAAGTGQEPSAAPKPPSTPAAGYAFSDKPAPARRASRGVRHVAGPIATYPGFEQLADGGSRVFVQLSQAVPVEERRTHGALVYVLKGTHVNMRNNTNALVTVHFNTPVSRAKLVPAGKDLHLVVDLRAAAQPTYKLDEGQDRTAVLSVFFPKGEFLDKGLVQGGGAAAAGSGDAEGDSEAPSAKGPSPSGKKPRGPKKGPAHDAAPPGGGPKP